MEIQKEKLVVLSEDNKAVALRNLNQLYHAVGDMYNRVKNNQLNENMRDTLFFLFEDYVSEASKAIGYDSEATKRIDERYADIRKANNTIRELEEKLANNTQVDGMTKLMSAMHMAVYDWWKKQGFNLVTDDSFGFYGYKARFCLDTRSISFIARNPVTQKSNNKSKLEQMIENGFEFVLESEDEYVLLDTENNRQKITNLVKSKFPSLDIFCWKNWRIHNSDKFRLRDFECYIRNLSELKQLMDEIKNTKDEENV